MSWVGVVFVLAGLLIFPFAVKQRSNAKVAVFAAAFVIHLTATLFYFDYVQTNDADTRFYYFDPFGFIDHDFAFGTQFTLELTQAIRNLTDGTYLDLFLFFSSIGFMGIAVVMRVLEEVFELAEADPPILAMLLLFIPGLYFWTSAIGKDAPLFLGCALAVWASLDIVRRVPAFAGGMLLCFVFRPHIAVIIMAALAMALVLVRNVRLSIRLAFVTASLVAVVAALPALEDVLKVDVSSSGSVGAFFENQQRMEIAGLDSNSTLVGAAYPVRLFSLLFRPLFFDATSIFGLIASFENVGMLMIFIFIVRNLRLLRSLSRDFVFLRFSIYLALLLIGALSIVWYNVGLGLRQRLMYIPPLCVIVATLLAVRQTQRQAIASARYHAQEALQKARYEAGRLTAGQR